MIYTFVCLRQSHQVRSHVRLHFLTIIRYVCRSTIELSVYCILQEPVLTFSKLKQVSISETLLEYGRNLIKLNSICILTYFEVSKIIKRIKSLSFQKVDREQISLLLSNLPYLYIFKFVCKHPLCIPTFYEKLKTLGNFKTSLTISYELILFNTSVFVICSQKNYKNLLNHISLVIFIGMVLSIETES